MNNEQRYKEALEKIVKIWDEYPEEMDLFDIVKTAREALNPAPEVDWSKVKFLAPIESDTHGRGYTHYLIEVDGGLLKILYWECNDFVIRIFNKRHFRPIRGGNQDKHHE